MGVNIFAPCDAGADLEYVERLANEKAKGRFDWCGLFKGPEGALLTLEQALAFDDDSAPYWVLALNGKMYAVKGREHWQRMLRDSGCAHVCFLTARG
jgi:hypothetical protein